MAVAAQEQLSPERDRPTRPARQRAVVWPSASRLQQSAPIIRLLAQIWTIPQVSGVGMHRDDSGIQLWVLMPDESLEAEARIYDAEAEYLTSTPPHSFTLRVIPLSRVRTDVLPPFEIVLER